MREVQFNRESEVIREEEPELRYETRHTVPDHQVLLLFNSDYHADLFRDWWFKKGRQNFLDAVDEKRSNAK